MRTGRFILQPENCPDQKYQKATCLHSTTDAPDNCSLKIHCYPGWTVFWTTSKLTCVGMRVVSTQQRRSKHPNHEWILPLTRNCQCDSDTMAEVFPRHMLSTHACMYTPNKHTFSRSTDRPSIIRHPNVSGDPGPPPRHPSVRSKV